MEASKRGREEAAYMETAEKAIINNMMNIADIAIKHTSAWLACLMTDKAFYSLVKSFIEQIEKDLKLVDSEREAAFDYVTKHAENDVKIVAEARRVIFGITGNSAADHRTT